MKQKSVKFLHTEQINEIFTRFAKFNPNPAIELNYSSPYTLLVAVILSAQATDKGVNKATPALFAVASTPDAMVKLGLEGLMQYTKTIGLYRQKSKNIISTSEILINRYNGNVPDNMEDLLTLPGVGRKSANVILNSIYKKETMPVDTHVFRVSNRLGLCDTKTADATEKALLQAIPHKWLINAHHWLVLHGRYTCTARKPKCADCILNDICNEYSNGPRT